jgi:hypothetical protein
MAFWKSETGGSTKPKIQTEVAELINPESQTPQSKIKTGTNRFFKTIRNTFPNIGEVFLLSNHLFTS